MRISLALAVAAVLGLGSTAARPADKPMDKPSGDNCFWARNVQSFAAPDDHTVYIRTGSRDIYRMDLLIPCPDVDWNQRVALRSSHGAGGSICNALDVEIVSHATGLGAQRCPVKSLRKLTPAEIAALPKRARP